MKKLVLLSANIAVISTGTFLLAAGLGLAQPLQISQLPENPLPNNPAEQSYDEQTYRGHVEASEPTGTSADASTSSSSSYPWTAEDLAQAAYEGHLSDEGIPGHQTLANECRSGFTTARDVLRAAIKGGMMPSRALNDAGYLEQLRVNLSEDLNVPVR